MMSREWRDNYNDWEEVLQLTEVLVYDAEMEDDLRDTLVDISNVAWDRINVLRREAFEDRRREEEEGKGG